MPFHIGIERSLASFAQEASLDWIDYDSLTGLYNRSRMMVELADMLDARKVDDKCAVLFLDLDKFKEVNDTLGHPVALPCGTAHLISSVRRLPFGPFGRR